MPTVAGAPVGTYYTKHHMIDKDIRVKQYGTQQQWDGHLKSKSH